VCAEHGSAARGSAEYGSAEYGTETSTARRVDAVIDAWFDSGSMPAAQVGYPGKDGAEEAMAFPADFITEAIDQTRGWFYSLLAVNVLVFGRSPYRHVMCLGHIVDADGRKMSKSIGNVIDPWELLNSRGADPLRWWMFTQGSPWTPTRVNLDSIDTSLREMPLTLWNTFSFFMTYASLNGFDPLDPGVPPASDRSVLDRWALSRLATTEVEVTDALDDYEPLAAAAPIGRLVDDLSNWYVRRSRRRFWRTDPDAPAGDSLAAQATLHEVLVRLSVLLAPFCPFLADRMWRELTGAPAESSVHLADWVTLDHRAVRDGGPIDAGLESEMALARRLTSLGRAARGEAGVKVRQPLARALVALRPGSPAILESIVADELNVDEVVVAAELGEVLRFELIPNFKLLGPRLGAAVRELKTALSKLDSSAAAAALEAGDTILVPLADGPVELGPDDVELRVKGQPGFAVSREGGEVVALDLAIDEGLARRGLTRDAVRLVQELRKTVGLDVSDRIVLNLDGIDELREFGGEIGREVLATKVVFGPGNGMGHLLELDGHDEVRAWIEKA